MFDMVENRSLAKSLKYWAYSYSKSNKLSQENTQPENICHIVFEKKKGCGGIVNRTSVMLKQPSKGFFKNSARKFGMC